VHAREARAGATVSLLYTGRSNVAHRLYEALGYVDVRAFPRAIRAVPATVGRPGRPWRWRSARRSDRRAIEALHRAGTADLYGFAPRPKGWWTNEPGWWVLERAGRAAGYARLEASGSGGLACTEAVAESPEAFRRLREGAERSARGRFLVLGSGSLGFWDARELEDLGYVRGSESFGVLMARTLPRARPADEVRAALGTDARVYAAFGSDGF
jgi:hypothetical protein